jgi:hypothetical protein
VTLSRKGAKSRTGGRLRSTGTKARTRVGPTREQCAELEKLKARARQSEKKIKTLTRELAEAGEQQTATSEVLQVISSSPGELKLVFEAMLKNATRICEANFGVMFRYEQGRFRVAAMLDLPPSFSEYLRRDDGFIEPPAPGTPRAE